MVGQYPPGSVSRHSARQVEDQVGVLRHHSLLCSIAAVVQSGLRKRAGRLAGTAGPRRHVGGVGRGSRLAVHSAACGPAAVASWASAVASSGPRDVRVKRVIARTDTAASGGATSGAKGSGAKASRGAARNGAAGSGGPSRGGRRLVIVESPAKARTIAGYLGKDYVVESSIGHIRDMPDKAAEIPLKYRKEPWARLGVNVDADFEPLYVVNADKKQQVAKLKSLLKNADELLLATDEDREGEAIAWHLLEELKPKVPHSRMVFHEITPEAIARAIANPQELDQGKVDAYQARRVLDRLYGYEVSPVLWKKVMPKLSAGRVQSVATRLVVDRERERIAFRPAAYSDLEAEFATKDHGKLRQENQRSTDPTSFTASLVAVDGRRVAQG